MHHPEKIDSLTSLDLDVELLEERIEMSALLHPLSPYVCNTNCESHGGKPVPQ